MIDDFRFGYRWLSNFHVADVEFEGAMYPSSEHAYQAAKSAGLFAQLTRAAFQDPGMTCGKAKKLGQTLSIRSDWEEVKITVMKTILLDKFTRHPELREKLLATRGHELVEGNTWGDRFWGVCGGVGENHLGRLLMEIREYLGSLDI